MWRTHMTTEASEPLHPAVYEEITGMLRDLFEHVRQLGRYQGKGELPFPPEPSVTQPETDPDMIAAQERERAHALERFDAEKADLQRRINSLTVRAERKRPAPVPSDPYTPTRRRVGLEPPSEERRPSPERPLSIQDTDLHKDTTWNPIVVESKKQTSEYWFRNCKDHT